MEITEIPYEDRVIIEADRLRKRKFYHFGSSSQKKPGEHINVWRRIYAPDRIGFM